MENETKHKMTAQERYAKSRATGKFGFDQMDKEQFKEIQAKGSKAGNIAIKKRVLLKDTLTELLSLPVKDPMLIKRLNDIGIVGKEVTQQTIAMLAVLKKAQTGDFYANTFIRDTIGQKETEKLEVTKSTVEVIADIEDYVNK